MANPLLYQVNPRLILSEVGRRLGRTVTLDDFPDTFLDEIAGGGFEWVWLLGVWQTGAAGRRWSRQNPEWRKGYPAVLPDFTDDDICGSPFAIQAYTVHTELGGDDALVRLRERLERRGLRLMLDFVPNHVALDHPWAQDHPEYFIHGSEADLARQPFNYTRVQTSAGPVILAHGRDPYFPGWSDSLQLNVRHPGLRAALIGQLLQAARLCDGLRCDMAMLLLPEVIQRTWGDASRPWDGSVPADSPFWPEAASRVRGQQPGFVLLAEVYWDLEATLLRQGFDLTYDKWLYDHLKAGNARSVRQHLGQPVDFQLRQARFLENHDEPRAAAAFPWPRHRAAAVVTFLTPGLRFFHDGQLEGRRYPVSNHLGRLAVEPVNPEVQGFYRTLLDVLKRPEPHLGRWQLLDCRPAWDRNGTWGNFLTWRWESPTGQVLAVCINFGPTQGQCYVDLALPGAADKQVELRDLLGPARYLRAGGELQRRGLYLDMPAWGYHVFEVVV
jgi:hypothetical protein